MSKKFDHVTVLLDEAVDLLDVKEDKVYVDMTLGGGGHTGKILQKLTTGTLYSFDQDATAIEYNKQQYANEIAAGKLVLVHSNFRNLTHELNELGINGVDGILYDLGVSSPQFDDASRGFSYNYDAVLDMRMDQRQALTAKEIVNEWSFNDLVRIFSRYGEEKFAKKIARNIEQARSKAPINTTFELVELIKDGIPAAARRHGGHPAKKVFQALRIAVNDELGALEDSLKQALDLINVNGKISVITFQSLEDRLVKVMFKEKTTVENQLPGLPIIDNEDDLKFKLLNKKPIIPTENEIEENNRAHSAKLRGIEKLRD